VTRVLVVDDEPQILRALRINLRVRQYQVSTAASGTEALEQAARHPPDLVILDLGLPDLDGVEVIQGLRGWTAAPIIVLSGRADSTDKVEALDAGADDYVTKPFGMDELLARMRAVSRRTATDAEEPRYQMGELVIDLAAKRVTRGPQPPRQRAQQKPRTAGHPAPGTAKTAAKPPKPAGTAAQPPRPAGTAAQPPRPADGGTDIRLTPTEWHLLEVLLRHPGRLLSQRQLLNEVWGPGYADAAGNLRLYMTQLRRKLEPDPARPRWLLTEPGMGYRFQPGPGNAETDAGKPA
jgi:two-component system, OmpR family, KDP operon response regulator KdpE